MIGKILVGIEAQIDEALRGVQEAAARKGIAGRDRKVPQQLVLLPRRTEILPFRIIVHRPGGVPEAGARNEAVERDHGVQFLVPKDGKVNFPHRISIDHTTEGLHRDGQGAVARSEEGQ